jgi:hypothetical protein
MSDRAARPHVCPSCGAPAERSFYEVDGVPVHQVKLVRTRAQALNCARGDIRMCFCASCGFVWNGAFEPARMRYEDDYESTQAASPTFNAFHERLARDLIERFDLHGKGWSSSVAARASSSPCSPRWAATSATVSIW